jgi:DNA polymerase III alpha subunit (gram-positive type)
LKKYSKKIWDHFLTCIGQSGNCLQNKIKRSGDKKKVRNFKTKNLMDNLDPKYIFVDVETEGLKAQVLLQVAAVTREGEVFAEYIKPLHDIPLSCTQITGLYNKNKDLFKNGSKLEAKSIRKVLKQFFEWISNFGGNVHLVCYNGFTFDVKVLLAHCKRQKLTFPSNIIFVHDPLPTFRKYLKTDQIKDFKLTSLALHFQIPFLDAHDALSDCECLKQICEKYTTENKINLTEFLDTYRKPIGFFIAKVK